MCFIITELSFKENVMLLCHGDPDVIFFFFYSIVKTTVVCNLRGFPVVCVCITKKEPYKRSCPAFKAGRHYRNYLSESLPSSKIPHKVYIWYYEFKVYLNVYQSLEISVRMLQINIIIQNVPTGSVFNH